MAETNEPDFFEKGSGHRVILVHSSVAGARQWRSLMESLSVRYNLAAVNLFGYGKTPAWSNGKDQTLMDQAELVAKLVPSGAQKVSIVGHSYGGSVAMKAAAMLKGRLRRLVLIEPNPFYLLAQNGRDAAYQEAATLRDVIKTNGRAGTWRAAAEVFANYWTGTGSWDAMPEDRQEKFAQALMPNSHEWDSVMNETTPMGDWERSLPSDTTVISAADTVGSIKGIVELMQEAAPSWRFEQLEKVGHMAALTRPDLMAPVIERALA